MTTVEANNAQLTGTIKPTTVPSLRAAPVSLASRVNAAQAATVAAPAGLTSSSTKSMTNLWMRAMIYSLTNARKTTTAANFSGPEATRIILTRGEDQLIPLAGRDFQYVLCDTMVKLRYAMQFPQKIWPGWMDHPERTLVIDDISKVRDMLVDDNETNEQGNKQNNMIVHREAKAQMADLMLPLLKRPIHLITIALANVYENNITHEENLTPDLPAGMNRMLTTDFTFLFYIDKAKWMFRTNDYRETYQDVDEKMKPKTFTRVILAKHKIAEELAGKGVINDLEKMDLRAIWNKVQAAKVGGVKP